MHLLEPQMPEDEPQVNKKYDTEAERKQNEIKGIFKY